MTEPSVSVLMACRNGARYLGEALDSVLAQNGPELEVVAVDDKSTDGTPELLERYARAHLGRIKLAFNDRQAGIPQVRARCLEMAEGSLICLLDQDDLWLPGKIGRQAEVLASEPEVALVHTAYEVFDDKTGRALPWQQPIGDQDGWVLRELFVEGCFVMSGTVMIRREALAPRKLGFWDLGLLSYDDYMLYLGLALDFPFAYVDEVLFRYRRHGANLTEELFADNVHLRRVALLREFLRRFPEARTRLGRARREGLAAHHLAAAAFERAAGRQAAAARYAAIAGALDPAATEQAVKGYLKRLLTRAPKR